MLEDVALISGIALVAHGKINLWLSIAACFLGISFGDLGLYVLGRLALRFRLISERKWFVRMRERFTGSESESWLTTAVFACRFIPGTRIATYALAGFVRYSILKFLIVTVISVGIWVGLAFQIGYGAREFFINHLFLAIVLLIAAFAMIRLVARIAQDPWQFRLLPHSWRKWTSFEFWPPWLFYLPVIPRYIYLSLRYRSFLLPFYANPFIEHAGLIGESKWDIYKYLQNGEFLLGTYLMQNTKLRGQKILQMIAEKKLVYPFIAKPDKGQRGFAVRVIKNQMELEAYLLLADFDLILQEFCNWEHEAGIFYIREPNRPEGRIFSITDKFFPFVLGDGETNLGNLILADKRARIMAGTYFSRFEGRLESVPVKGEKIFISTCGNHCQGAIFKNGWQLNSPELLASVEKVVRQIPDFYFGRLDVRYRSPQELKAGAAFRVVEINAAGSEATHIWDPQTSLLEAYRVLFEQWGILFEIGSQIKKMNRIQYSFKFLKFFSEVLNLKQQRKNLAVSS